MSDSPLKDAIVIAALLFFTTFVVGWFGTSLNPAMGENLMALFEKEIADQINGNSQPELFISLFANNLEACILLFVGGASFGIFTIFIMSLNGIVIGSILEIVQKDHTPLFVAAAIIPHGIFEIPAFIISGALGILLAQSLIAEWYGGADTGRTARDYARVFIVYVLPLVLMAAFVEAFITPVVVHLVS